MAETWTVKRMLDWMKADFASRGIETARLDAEILVAHALGLERIAIYLDLDRPLTPAELDGVRALVQRRRKFEPIAYLVGYRDFYKHRFEVTPAVLIPRPDTETLVEVALERAPDDARIVDLCTGSGCVAISVAAERREAQVAATDVSPEALEVARRNAERLEVRVDFREGDLFAGLRGPFDLVLANPPYLRPDEREELAPDVRDHEPGLALFAGSEGTEWHATIAEQAQAKLETDGILAMEVGFDQADAVEAILRDLGYESIGSHQDLGGVRRVVSARLG